MLVQELQREAALSALEQGDNKNDDNNNDEDKEDDDDDENDDNENDDDENDKSTNNNNDDERKSSVDRATLLIDLDGAEHISSNPSSPSGSFNNFDCNEHTRIYLFVMIFI
jgi:hypothetical protein